MPRKLYRAMFADGSAPRVGDGDNELGVRLDRDMHGSEVAGPTKGGPSVNVDRYDQMPLPIRPVAFGGANRKTVMFEALDEMLDTKKLVLGKISRRSAHASIESAIICALSLFRAHVGETRPHWQPSKEPS